MRVGEGAQQKTVMLPEDRPVVTPQGVVQRPREARQAQIATTIAARQAETPSRPEVLAGRARAALTSEEKQQQAADIVAGRLATAETPAEREQRLADIEAEAAARREPLSDVEARARAQARGAGLLDTRTGAEKGKPTWNQAFSALQDYYYNEFGELRNPSDATAPESFDALDRMARAVVSGTVPAQGAGEMERLGQIVQQYTAGMNRGPGAVVPTPVTAGREQVPPPSTPSTKTEVSQAQFDAMVQIKQEDDKLSPQDALAFVTQRYRVKQP
jgi:hypothetical protein